VAEVIMRVKMFGALEVVDGTRRLGPRDLGGVKPKRLFEILLTRRGAVVTKDELADLLWGERLPRDHVATLEAYVSVLRTKLQPGVARTESVIVTTNGGYCVATDRLDIDIDRFDDLAARARAANGAARAELLAGAVALVSGELLEDEPYVDWVQELRARYLSVGMDTLLASAGAELDFGRAEEAWATAERVLSIDHLREAAYRVAMEAAAALGRREVALRLYYRCAETLAAELGVVPLPETVAVRDAVLRGTPDVVSKPEDRTHRVARSIEPVRCRASTGAVVGYAYRPLHRRPALLEVRLL
jgi:DNA-binding SARP family transcriptional activator